ncbi:hypothetical protein SAMD00019534_059880, partial [Acytostelium subglobosum LB1]|uniref:hypothetical protein n=1 Tax=Acytostelium subglobosum LB1 TaxID=1410327 RepID=UPI0006452184
MDLQLDWITHMTIRSPTEINSTLLSGLDDKRQQQDKEIEDVIMTELNDSELLPIEVWVLIMVYLYERDLVSVSMVSRYLNKISMDNFLWKPLYLRRWNVITMPHRDKSMVELSDAEFRQLLVRCQSSSTPLYIKIYNQYWQSQMERKGKPFITMEEHHNLQPSIVANNTRLFTPTIIHHHANQRDSQGLLWKLLYQERKMMSQFGGIEEFYHLLSTLIAFPLEFNQKALMSMYTNVFELCMVNYNRKDFSIPPLNLYRILVECCHKHLTNVLAESTHVENGRPLIQFYLFHWQNYLYSIKRVNIVFRYFYRDWISKQSDEAPSRPWMQHIKNSEWWTNLLMGTDKCYSIVQTITMMARGWMSVLFKGLQVNTLNNSTDAYEDDASARRPRLENRLIDSIQICAEQNEITQMYSFLLSLLHLQECLLLNGEETHQFFSTSKSEHLNQILGGGKPDQRFRLLLSLLPQMTRCNLCNSASTIPPILCNEEMNKVSIKLFSILRPPV